MNFLDRNEFNFEPSQKVVEAIKNFDPKDLCFYTRIYDQGKKSVISVRLSEIYHVPEEQVLLTYSRSISTSAVLNPATSSKSRSDMARLSPSDQMPSALMVA